MNTFLCIEKLEEEEFPCMCSYRSNFIDSIEVNNEKSDNCRKETPTVSGCTERHSLCVENTL